MSKQSTGKEPQHESCTHEQPEEDWTPGKLVAGLPLEQLVKQLRLASKMADTGNHALAFYLQDMRQRRVSVIYGCVSAAHYAEERLGIESRRARELLFVGRALQELEKTNEAFLEDKLSWSQVVLLARVAVPETEEAWIERASGRSCRKLEFEIVGVQRGQLPKVGNQGGLPRLHFEVHACLNVLAHELWEKAKLKLQHETGQSIGDAELMQTLAEMLLASDPDGVPQGRKKAKQSIYQVVIQATENEAAVLAEAGPVALEDGAGAGHVGPLAPKVPAVDLSAAEKVLSGGVHIHEPTSEGLRKAILARDGYRCLHCGTNRRELHAHHKKFRGKGGPTTPENLLCLCTLCHALVHEGFLTVSGACPDGLEFRATRKMLGRLEEPTKEAKADPSDQECGKLGARAPRGAPRSGQETFAQAGPPPLAFHGAPQKGEKGEKGEVFEIPAEVTAEWWRENSHLFKWNRAGTRVRLVKGVCVADDSRQAGRRRV